MNLPNIRRLRTTIAIAALALTLPMARANALTFLELDYGNHLGTGYLTDASGSAMKTILQAGGANTIETVSSLSAASMSLTSYDAIWVSNNVATTLAGSSLAGGDVTGLTNFLAAGKKVVMLGDKATTYFSTYDNSILGVVGGAYASNVAAVATLKGNTLAAPSDQILTSGLTGSGVSFGGYSLFLTGSGSPEVLFNDGAVTPVDVPIAGLFHSGGGEALVILDANWMASSGSINITTNQNTDFAHNILAWLSDPPASEAPEPASLALFGFGLLGMMGLGLRRRRVPATC